MSFSATEWRNRMSYYDNTYASLNFSWSNLGAAQGDRKYFTFTFDASYGTTGALGMGYLSCTFYSFAPCVEAMNQYVYWQITYTYYLNTYNFTDYGDYTNGYTFMYVGQNAYNSYMYLGYKPAGYYSTYYSYWDGFVEQSQYYAVQATPGFFDQGTYRTFYNYKNGPYLGYYQYSLSNGTYTNYPFQTCTREGVYYQCN